MDIDAGLLKPSLPEYGSASLSDILPSTLALLDVPAGRDVLGFRTTLDGVRRVAVLLIDGLGYHLYPRAAASSAILAAANSGELGSLRRLTTNFPSTTPTSLVSLGTGVAPGRHGVLGFTVNVPGGDELLTHIRWGDEPDPLTWQPVTTCFEHAAAAGVSTTAVSRVYPTNGLYRAAFRGSRREGVDDATETAAGIRAALAEGDSSMVYGYFPTVDKMGHEAGVDSDRWHDAVAEVDYLLRLAIAELPSDTAILVTADHGMINIDDDARLDVAGHPQLREGVRLIAGEPRVRYVHTHPGAADDVAAAWRQTLGDRAEVWTRAEAIAGGWFGPVDAGHAQRIGDLVVVCRDRFAIVGVAEADTSMTALLRGYHGSTTEAEMAIPLWIYRGGG